MTNKRLNAAELYLQNAFSISLEDSLEETAKMFRSLQASLLQESVKKELSDSYDKIMKKLDRLEKQPSKIIPLNIYELSNIITIYNSDPLINQIVLKDADTLERTYFTPREVKEELRKVMNSLSELCGEISGSTGMTFNLPARITAKGV